MRAQQSTLVASGPTESCKNDSGMAPSTGTRNAVGLKPTKPLNAAGMRTLPPVSEPRAATHMPSATLTAAPLDEPPGTRPPPSTVRPQAARGVPKCGLIPTPENANSTMLVRPNGIAPAARRRATTGASCVAAGRERSTVEPAPVTSPATSNKSLIDTVMPSSGRALPSSMRVCDCNAAWRTSSALSDKNVRDPSPFASLTFSMWRSTIARGLSWPLRKSA